MAYTRNLPTRAAAAFCLVLCFASIATCDVTVRVRNPHDRTLRDVALTFGQVFRRGDGAGGVVVRGMGGPVPAQVDVKRRYDNGSVRFAVISLVLNELAAGQGLTLTMADGDAAASAPGLAAGRLLEAGFNARVVFRMPDGTVLQADARRMLADAIARKWLSGPTATEWILSGPPSDAHGRPDKDLHVQFHVRTYAGCRQARVSVVVENCWDHWAGNVGYGVSVQIGGREVFNKAAVDHRRLSRWRKTFWWGRQPPDVHVFHDLGYLSSTGALPNYDRTLPASESNASLLEMKGADWEIMGRGPLTAYMPTTGGRPEIAPYPAWTVRYLLTMDPRWRSLVLKAGDLAGSWPIHVRRQSSRRIMTIDERPEFWLDARGSDRPEWQPDRSPPGADQTRLTPDLAHQASLAYVPYLVTGDYYYLDESYFWANYCLLATWPHPRRGAEGILSGQIRGNAWALRNMADAASIAPHNHPQRRYFDQKIRNNLADRIKRMYGPPEYNKLGFWGPRTTADARIQNPADPDWMITAPWEHDYLIWSLHHLAELGYRDAAKPRDFLLRWRVGMLTHPKDFDPKMAAPYRMVVGRRISDGGTRFYDDWKQLALENARLYGPGLPGGGNGYAYSARAALICGVDGGFPGADRALKTLETLLPGRRETMARQPHWAITCRGAQEDR